MPRKKMIDDTKILKMALEVIIEMGATTFSLEDLRNKTGLSPATLLQRFGSKKNILHKAIELSNNDVKNSLNNKSVVSKSPIQEVINIYLELSMPFSTPGDIASGLDILKLDITEKKLNSLTRKYFEIRRKKIESLIILAQKKNEISSSVNASEIVWNLESLWQGSIMLWALIGNGNLQKWLKKRLDTFINYL
jgi:hypothetical protein